MRAVALTALAVLGLLALTQCTQDSPTSLPKLGPPNSIGIYFDSQARRTSINIDPGEPFYIYVIAFDLPGDLAGSRFGIGGLDKIEDDPEPSDGIQIIADHIYPEGVGSDRMSELAGLYWLDHGDCHPAEGAVILMRIEARLIGAAEDYTLVLGPNGLIPDSDCPASPGYFRCDGSKGCLIAAYDGAAVINPSK